MSSRTINVQTLAQLESLRGAPVPAGEREAMAAVLEAFPVRLSRHLRPLVARSPALARQFLPDAREAGGAGGDPFCFQGLLHTGIPGVERMYVDRCIVMPQPTCPAYCRFCFRKFYEHADGRAMTPEDMDRFLAYVAADPRLREVLVTGGEPVMDPPRLARILGGLRAIPHVGPIRVACRSLVMAPELVDDRLVALLAAHQDLRAGRPVEVALHCNHPDEITPETVDGIARLREAGIHVYDQTVLLRGVNDHVEVMAALLRRLRSHGVEAYTIFFGGPVRGMEHQRPRLDEALALMSALRRRLTGRANPRLIVTTRLGKVALGVDGWITGRDPGGRHVWIRTPYRLDDLRSVDPAFALPDDARLDGEGFIVMRYLDGPRR